MKLKRNDKILIGLVLFGNLLILFSFFLVLSEANSAGDFCDSINQTYSFFPTFNHKCDGNQVYKYNSKVYGEYWGFNSMEDFKINLSKVPTNP